MLTMDISRNSEVSLTRQVYGQIRQLILDGRLPAGERLPPSRELASSIRVSRNIVVEAYEMLIAEGFIEGRQGAGTYVAEGAHMTAGHMLGAPAAGHMPGALITGCMPAASKVGALQHGYLRKTQNNRSGIIDFRSGLPAMDLFPAARWGRIYRDICAVSAGPGLGYGDPAGSLELRFAICRYLNIARGICCDSDDMIITTGAVQALQIATSLLLQKGCGMILEDPSNNDLWRIFSFMGASVHAVEVDQHGIRTDMLPTGQDIRLIYVTPSHQFPMGGLLPIQRRIELIDYARKYDCCILEDDYDSEYRFEGPPVSSLHSLDPERVIYVGTFSKTLFPALRIGYMVLPGKLVKDSTRLKKHSDYQTPVLEQLTLARFIEEGLLAGHISRMKKIYRKRREVLVKRLQDSFGNSLDIEGTSAGLHLVACLDRAVTAGLLNSFKRNGVRVYPVGLHSRLRDRHRNELILGYGHLGEDVITEGVERIKNALEEL